MLIMIGLIFRVGLTSCFYLAGVISFPGRENFKMIPFYLMSRGSDSRGGGVLPYMGYIGTCRGIGYDFPGVVLR